MLHIVSLGEKYLDLLIFHEQTQSTRPKVKKIIIYSVWTSTSLSKDFACSVDDPALTKVPVEKIA